IAANEIGISGLDPYLTGPTAFAFVQGDAVAVAKSLRDFARTNPKLVVKGGLLGTKVLSAADAGALADVAPREVQLAQLAGALAAPLRQMAGLLAAIPTNFAYGLAALIDQQGGPPAAVLETSALSSEAQISQEVFSPEVSTTQAQSDEDPSAGDPAQENPAQENPAQESKES
ncbi:MAG: 50S ribosomal protein L10, partial [Pseudonocardiaceae bacterium]